MSNDYKTRDIPMSLKVVLAVVTLLTAVNTFLSGFTTEIKEEAKINVTTSENIESMNNTLDGIQKRLKRTEGVAGVNSSDIQSLQTNLSNVEQNQENVRQNLRTIDQKIDKVYSILLDMQRGN